MTREMVCDGRNLTKKDMKQIQIYGALEGIEISDCDIRKDEYERVIVLVDDQPAVNFLRRFGFVGK